MSKKNSSYPVRERAARRRHRSAQCRTGAVRPSSGSSADACWSSSRPRCRWSSSRSGAGGLPPGGPPADLSLAFRPAAARAHLRAISPAVARAGLHGLDRGGPAVFRGVEARAAAYGANGYSRNSYAIYGYGRGYRPPIRRRRLRLTPMAEPMPLPTTAATTSPHIGDTAPGAFWSVMKTNWANALWRPGLAPGRLSFGPSGTCLSGSILELTPQ